MADPIITIAEARAYAHDNESTDEEMAEYIALAEEYMTGAIGTYDPKKKRARHLAKLLVCDFNTERSTTAKDANTRALLVSSLILQLKTEPPVSNLDTGTTVTEVTDGA
ncbi:MAG: hypothetical protein CVU91_13400 [Firmicutes bacterium HGW-Firmicutes-16]|nr:MAG: hypothetical protein CVU91_13400 [Firmicutes bacterium HGW-Firmicutes-16]